MPDPCPAPVIANEMPAVARSLWTATAGPAPSTPPLDGEAAADVVVIGGGFTGLSTALHLAEAGVSVVVLEAESPGWGASGRNGGQVIPGLKHDPEELEALFGAEQAERLIAMVGGAADLVFQLIERHGIDCDARRQGWIQAAHDAAGLAAVERRAADWAGRGAPVEVLDRASVGELIGSERYVGGLVDRRGGALHPLNYALGLAAAAIRAGAVVCGQSRVTAIDRSGHGFLVRTASGVVRTGRIVIGTNAHADGLIEPLRRSVVPVRSVQVATRPLSANLRRSILPEGQVVSDTRRLLLYFRLDAEGRFLMGGRGAFGERGVLARQADLRRVTVELFPQLGDIEWQHHWGGFVALTTDHLPHLHEIEPGIATATGYNGRGVAMATAMGKELARWASGTAARDLAFPVTGIEPVRFHALRKPAISALAAFYRLQDRLGLGAGRL